MKLWKYLTRGLKLRGYGKYFYFSLVIIWININLIVIKINVTQSESLVLNIISCYNNTITSTRYLTYCSVRYHLSRNCFKENSPVSVISILSQLSQWVIVIFYKTSFKNILYSKSTIIWMRWSKKSSLIIKIPIIEVSTTILRIENLIFEELQI